jgi:hypothetical protein
MNNVKKKGGKKVSKTSTAKKSAKMKQPEAVRPREGGILVEAAYNVEESAKKMSKKASKFAEKGTAVAGEFYEKIREGLTDVYEFGIKLADEISQNAQVYIEKYKNSTEMKKLIEEKNKLFIKLGSLIYLRSKMRSVKSEDILKDNGVTFLVNEIEKKNKDIIKVGKKLEGEKK